MMTGNKRSLRKIKTNIEDKIAHLFGEGKMLVNKC